MSVSPEFEKWVIEWVDLDDTVKKAAAEIRKLKERQKILSALILDYMKMNAIPDIGIQDGVLEFKETVRKVSLNRTDMIDLIGQSGMLKGSTTAEDLVEFMYSNRRERGSETIKRSVNRKKKKQDKKK